MHLLEREVPLNRMNRKIMKVRAFIFCLLVACGVTASQWIPQTNQAVRVNTPVWIKGLITELKTALEKDEDTFPEQIRQLSEQAAACPDPAGKAVLHSMLAEMYHHYYQRNQWQIRQRTALSDYVPADLREWTSQLFQQQIEQELQASLLPDTLLQQIPISQYRTLLQQEGDTALRPTLYDFLVGRAIELQPSPSYYQQWEQFRKAQSQPELWVQIRLEQLAYLLQVHQLDERAYQQELKNLLTTCESYSYSNRVRHAWAEHLLHLGYQQAESKRSGYWEQALALCEAGIQQFPKATATPDLQHIQQLINQTKLQIQYPQQLYPGEPLSLQIRYRNVRRISVRIYQSLRTPEKAWSNLYGKAGTVRGPLLKEVLITTKDQARYVETDTLFSLPNQLPLGLYECVVTEQDQGISDSRCFAVSRLALLLRDRTDGRKELLVADSKTGAPQPGVTLYYYRAAKRTGEPYRAGAVQSDREGLAQLPLLRDLRAIRPILGKDTCAVWTTAYSGSPYRASLEEPVEVNLFTDRGLYRPGQTLFVKGIAYVRASQQPRVLSGQRVELQLRNAQQEEVSKQVFTTDEWGAFQGEFVVPQGGLSGSYTLWTAHGETTVQVEEYRRPTFWLQVDSLQKEVSFGQPVQLAGTAQTFSGAKLTTGTVEWQILRRPFWMRYGVMPFWHVGSEQVASGTATVDSQGRFALEFVPERPVTSDMEYGPRQPLAQSYELRATLTDSKGETQAVNYRFSVAEVGLFPQVDAADRMELSQATFRLTIRHVNQQVVDTTARYVVYRLSEQALENATRRPKTETYAVIDTVCRGLFDTRVPLTAERMGLHVSGRYRIVVTIQDQQGRSCVAERDFILYQSADRRPPVYSPIWLVEQQTECLPGEEARWILGTSCAHTYLLYELFAADGQRIQGEWIRLNNENRSYKLPYVESYGEGVTAQFTMVQDGRWLTRQIEIRRRQPNRQLTLIPQTFRDHLLPGSSEEWKFRVVDADSIPVVAQLLAGMYDASLDQLLPFRWSFQPQWRPTLYCPSFRGGSAFGRSSGYVEEQVSYAPAPVPQPVMLDWQQLFDRGFSYRLGGVMLKSASNRRVADDSDAVVMEEAAVADAVAVTSVEESEECDLSQVPESGVKVRSDLAETAFFFPTLRSDSTGETAFRFTLPENNTTWKVQLLAHTADLKWGSWSGQVITQKPLMVLPNLPRFLRQGDQVTLSTQVMNQSDQVVEGRVRLELFDPETEQPVVCLTKSQKSFQLEAGAMTSVEWTLPVPTNCTLVGCRILAESDQGSDGEQHLLPVLSDQLFVTESQPFYLLQEGEQQVKLPDWSVGTTLNYTLELSENPIWQAVQALPTLAYQAGDNLITCFSRYYAATLAASIAQHHPSVQSMIRQWEAEGSSTTRLTPLERDESLKAMLLEETPWLLEARNEQEQQQQLSLLFDANRLASWKQTWIQRLQDEQQPDGGWSWFPGFPVSSPYITQYILRGMTQLVQLNATSFDEAEKRMQMDALAYMDRYVAEQYQHLLRQGNLSACLPDPMLVDFLFVRSFYRDVPEAGEAREAIRFYTDQAARQWKSYGYYEKAEIAWLLKRNGRMAEATTIWKWIERTATHSTEQGCYWANNRRTNGWHAPIETHCLLMAFAQVMDCPATELDQMRQWLLNQKRTQQWESETATAQAIYALLLTGNDWLATPNHCQVQWGGLPWLASAGETGTGYRKEVIEPVQLRGDISQLSIRKQGTAPAWGAVYRQSFQPIRAIKQQSGAIQVEKRFFVKRQTATGPSMQPVTDQTAVTVGDQVVVRLVVRNDRDMDFVVLKDVRPACFEPVQMLSGVEMRDGLYYYHTSKDASEQFFFDHLPKGTYVLEYTAYVTRTGDYAGGISTLQCMYAPEFVAHTEGIQLTVEAASHGR